MSSIRVTSNKTINTGFIQESQHNDALLILKGKISLVNSDKFKQK